MSVYVGLDVSLEETHYCITDQHGKRLKEGKTVTDPAAVADALASIGADLKRIGLEASSVGAWLANELKSMNYPAIVVEARHMRTALKTQRNKTDRNDARGIAEMMRLGWYRAVYVKSPESQRLRMPLANRRLLKRKLIDIGNHIRGSLRAFGLFMGQVSRGKFEARARELAAQTDGGFDEFVDTMLTVRSSMLEGYKPFMPFSFEWLGPILFADGS